MRALAAIAAREATPNYFSNGIRVGGMKARKDTNKRFDISMQLPLVFIIGDACSALNEPFASSLFQN
jgi:hypothetical protein